jgi:NAD(P)-dependent dehydrogenase (short-subunit alcohol dehydrogenase family)
MSARTKKTALVTGASSGIGRATAEALVKAGFTVFGTSRHVASKGPEGVVMLPCDVTDDVSVESAVKTVIGQTGRIDLLVNNAGIGAAGAAEEFSTEEAKALFDVNVFGVMRVTRAVLPTMRAQHEGRIVNISSVYGLIPGPYVAPYVAAKYAVEGYSESVDHEVRPDGIRVVLVEPAYTNTSIEQNTLRPQHLLPHYDEARAGLEDFFRKLAVTGDSPEVVAEVVLKAAQDKNPKLRYPAGKIAQKLSVQRRFVPAFLFDKAIRKQMNLPN